MFVEYYVHADGVDQKVGQAALLRSGRIWVFRDQIQLLPEAVDLLPDCLRITIEHFGVGLYRYGSRWTWETVPEMGLCTEPPVSVRTSSESTIEAIDLGAWGGYEQYYRGVSANIRRNDARCRRLGAEIDLQWLHGLSAIRGLPQLFRVRWHVLRRKVGAPWLLFPDMLRTVAQLLAFRRTAVLIVGRHRGRALSVFFGIRQGETLHHVTGGTLPNRIGIGPHLFIRAIRWWYELHPRGLIVMGISDGKPPESHCTGHLLFRRKLRVASRRTAIIGIEHPAK